MLSVLHYVLLQKYVTNFCTFTVYKCSCNLHDQSRAIEDITISPCGRLAAAVDSFGRVLLVDTQRMLITKMWKGNLNYFDVCM